MTFATEVAPFTLTRFSMTNEASIFYSKTSSLEEVQLTLPKSKLLTVTDVDKRELVDDLDS